MFQQIIKNNIVVIHNNDKKTIQKFKFTFLEKI